MPQKWVEYPFLVMPTNANTIAKSSVWTEPKKDNYVAKCKK